MTDDSAVLDPWKVRGLPATFVLDKQGGIAYSALGVEDFASDAVGTPHWMERDSEGRLPPPPLNGTAHAWHHDRDTLRRTILKGTGELGGTMPAWAGVLTIDDVDSVIDWIISLWSDSIYAMWRERTSEP